jgi:hypothetical protein
MKYINKTLLIAIAFLAITGCKKLDIPPTDRFSDLTFWTVDENVTNALNNNYSLMYNSSLYFDPEALSDNAFSPSGDLNLIASGNATSLTAKFQGDWAYYYSSIKSVNIFLENVDQNTTLPAATKARMKAENQFMRAFALFNLTKWYGDVPVPDHNLTPEEAQVIARTPRAEVYAYIISQLNEAIVNLPSQDQLLASENGRITKGAALALQMRALLYQGDKNTEVIAVCEKLMNEQSTYGTYALAPSYSGLFSDPATNKTNSETILSLQYVPTIRTWQNYWDFAPRSVGGRVSNMAPTQELVNDYIMLNGRAINEAGSGYSETTPYINRDPRLTATVVYDGYTWVNANNTTKTIYIKPGTDPVRPGLDEYTPGSQSASATGYYWRKYFDPIALSSFVSGNNLHLFRYAEVLLTYAEAKNSVGQMDASVWSKTIGALRSRAGFTDAGALNMPGGDLTNVIRRERRVELAMEGLRVDDIRRWKVAEVTMNGYAHGAKFGTDPNIDGGYIRTQQRRFNPQRDYLWAIPSNEVSLNKNLTQNPGY